MIHRLGWVSSCFLVLALGGCDSSTGSAGVSGGTGGAAGGGGTGGASRLVVTADLLNQSLTLLDYARLVDGESDGPSSVLDTIDLSEWEPGPIEVEISPDGTTALVAVGPALFDSGVTNTLIGSPEVSPGGTLSPLVPTGNDPSDVTFLNDETRVVVANSFSLDITLVDTSDPSAPAVIDSFEVAGGFPYGATYMPGRDQILAPTGTGSNLVTIDRDRDLLIPRLPVMLPGREFPLTAAVDPAESFAFVAHIVERELSIIDLESGALRSVTWLAGPGPSYVAVQP